MGNRPKLLFRLQQCQDMTHLRRSLAWREASLDNIQALLTLIIILPFAMIQEVQSQILKLLAEARACITDVDMLKMLTSLYETFVCQNALHPSHPVFKLTTD